MKRTSGIADQVEPADIHRIGALALGHPSPAHRLYLAPLWVPETQGESIRLLRMGSHSDGEPEGWFPSGRGGSSILPSTAAELQIAEPEDVSSPSRM